MRFHRLPALLLPLALVALHSACVVRHQGGFAFAQGSERAERTESLPLELAAGESLDVELLYGDVRVSVSDLEAPHVEAHWHANADDKATAEAVLARYKLELVRSNGSLSLRSVGEPLEVKTSFVTNRLAAGVDLTLTVPSKVKLAVRSSSGDLAASGGLGGCRLASSYGDLSAAGIRGETSLSTSSGDVEVDDIEAEHVEANSQYGDIAARNLRATAVRLTTSSGHVRAQQVQGELSVKSSYGDLSVEDSNGALEAVTSSGDIDVSVSGEARRRLATSYGDIKVRGADGDLDAKTSSGDVSIDGSSGSVSAVSSYGDVAVKGRWTRVEASTGSGKVSVQAAAGSTASESWRINSNYGDARLEIPVDFSCELSAHSSSGEVNSPFMSADDKRHRTLKCTLGAGGSRVEVHSASGDVTIKGGAAVERKI